MSEPTFVLLTPDFKPATGGIAEYLHQLWQKVAQVYPAIVISSMSLSGNSWQHDYTLKIIPFSDSTITSELEILRIKRCAAALGKTIEKLEGKLEFFIGVWTPETHFWCEILQKSTIAYSIFTHGLELVSPAYARFQTWQRYDLQQAKAIYSNSTPTHELVQKIVQGKTPVNVVNPGTDLSHNSSILIELAKSIKEQLNLKNKFVLLTVGRLIPRKGIDLVLQSLPPLLEELPELYYFVIGSGQDQKRLQEIAESLQLENVCFLGQVDELTKMAFYLLCDLFVMPNRTLVDTDWEGFGIVFLEAALASKPSIGGNNGGVTDAIISGVTGLLVDTEEYEPIYQAIRKLLLDEPLRLKMGKAAYDRVTRDFSWDVSAKNFLNQHSLLITSVQ
jgi:glycosyltransferase involved in cell wall biosynthesis